MNTIIARAAILASAFAFSTTAAAQEDDGPTAGFSYEVPSIARALPGLSQRLDNMERNARSEFDQWVSDWPEDSRGPAYDALSYEQSWQVAGANEQLLSLVSGTFIYSGGAHGGTRQDTLIWDVERDRAIAFPALFTDRYAALSLIDAQLCPALRAQQVERGVIDEGSEPDPLDFGWTQCPFFDEITIAPASNFEAGPFDHFEIVVGEYVAGPYVVGTFEIEVAMTPALLALVRSEYRGSFAVAQ